MADSAVERSRRARAHRRGDHRLCRPERCELAGQVDIPPEPVTSRSNPAPRDLAARGRRLWAEMVTEATSPPQRVLIEEACRIADRLDRLDRRLLGLDQEWLRLKFDEGTGRFVFVVDGALSEARLQAVALKSVLGELRQSQASSAPANPKPAAPTAPVDEEAAPGVSDLTRRIAARRSASPA